MSKIIIFANGESTAPFENMQYIENNDVIICADGGAWYAMEMNIVPELLIGDFDSIDTVIIEHLRSKGTRIQQFPVKKDKTDLELALDAASEFPQKKILILTAFGGRIDQLLANIMLITRNYPFEQIGFADSNQIAWIMRGKGSMEFTGNIGDIFSLIPISDTVQSLTISGVEWPLQNKDVERGSTLTLSNTFTEVNVTVSIENGIALVVHIKTAR